MAFFKQLARSTWLAAFKGTAAAGENRSSKIADLKPEAALVKQVWV